MEQALSIAEWMNQVIKQEEIDRYLENGKDFIDDALIVDLLVRKQNPERQEIKAIIDKSLALERLEPEETAALLNCKDEDLWEEIFETGGKIKEKVYGRRIVTFAPLYVSNLCVNSCIYCGFRKENPESRRKRLSMDELREEVKALVSQGHKRLIMVYGEHPLSDADYIAETLEVTYATKVGNGEIRRANINAAPMCIEDLKKLQRVGIGTFQVFQETYNHRIYQKLHSKGIKANYRWRLYALHRALEAGVDDVAIGALFGVSDWKFEVMGLLYHAIDLEKKFGGIGPHTISFPRLEPAVNTKFYDKTPFRVDDRDFKKLVAVIRLSVPYTGMILTARERPEVRREVIPVGCTQTDAGSNIGIGAYSQNVIEVDKQQFILGDTRSLDEVIRELAQMGYITSFCTAGYRCGRTGNYFMSIAKKGKVGNLCMPNAITTFKEYLIDYASPETREIGEKLIAQELERLENPTVKAKVTEYLERIENGERDLYL